MSSLPPLLEPYLALPHRESLIALTGVLGANVSWLSMHFVASYLGQGKSANRTAAAAASASSNVDDNNMTGANDAGGARDNDHGADVKMVVVSFMRDFHYWNDCVGRLVSPLESLCFPRQARVAEIRGGCFPYPETPAGRRTQLG